ncbi:MAG: HAD hydrolase family protein [Elusimicrobiaceae bacterium]|nr:HAD hydrolase family protein [Elusimicrobiaceae bacterium]
MQNAQQRAQKIKAILTDVDGILTDGKVNFFVTQDGRIEEFKSFNTQDGIALMLCHCAGLLCGIITGRRHPTTVERAKNLGFKYMYQGFLTKMGPLEDVLKKEGLTPEEVCYIGDDITDLPLLLKVGFAATVPNALDIVKENVHYVTKRVGGDGAFREIIDFILNAQGKLGPILEQIKASSWVHGPKPEMQIVTSQEGIK